jgi:hypothetical protein
MGSTVYSTTVNVLGTIISYIWILYLVFLHVKLLVFLGE